MHPFTLIFLSFLIASILVRLWLSQRQINHIQIHKNQVPPAFADKIKLEDHEKAADYSCTKLRIGRVSLTWESLWLLFWTLGGGLNAINLWWADYNLSPLLNGIAVIATLSVMIAVLEMPFSIYNTFVVEERFGFNQTTLKTWLMDLVKTSLLMLTPGLPVFALCRAQPGGLVRVATAMLVD